MEQHSLTLGPTPTFVMVVPGLHPRFGVVQTLEDPPDPPHPLCQFGRDQNGHVAQDPTSDATRGRSIELNPRRGPALHWPPWNANVPILTSDRKDVKLRGSEPPPAKLTSCLNLASLSSEAFSTPIFSSCSSRLGRVACLLSPSSASDGCLQLALIWKTNPNN